MRSKGIDVELSLSILDDINAGLYDRLEAVTAEKIPEVDGRRVIAIRPGLTYSTSKSQAEAIFTSLDLNLPSAVAVRNDLAIFDVATLHKLGEALFSRAAFGILTGGSATSYADRKKNLAYGEAAFAAVEKGFGRLEPLCRDRPKGLTPAYINPDGSPGASFLILKIRARLIAMKQAAGGDWRKRPGKSAEPFLPLFQMSSSANDAELALAYADMTRDPLIRELAATLGGLEKSAAIDFATGIQPMIAALSHSEEGRPRRIFDRAWGRADSSLPLPGGHGQSFRMLTKVFRKLHADGLRWAWLGNVDNLGCLPDPVKLAILALSGEPAAFEFAYRTPLDVKGGILVETPKGQRTIADIGPAISFTELKALENAGASILFNCATGLFDLDWLVPRLDEVARNLPVRISDQDKDAGRYAQAEQVTWEIAGQLPSFLSFAVEKQDRFLSAKLLVETLLTSGCAADDSRIPADLAMASRVQHKGLVEKLSGAFGLTLINGRWIAPEAITS